MNRFFDPFNQTKSEFGIMDVQDIKNTVESYMTDNDTTEKLDMNHLDYEYVSNFASGSEVLVIRNSHRIPAEVRKFKWVKKLIITSIVREITNLPPNLEELVADNGMIDTISDIPMTIKSIMMRSNGLKDFPNMSNHTNLVLFDVSHNRLSALPELPSSVRCLGFSNNMIKNVDLSKYKDLEEIIGSKNKELSNIQTLTPTIQHMDFSECKISVFQMNNFPNAIHIDLSKNEIKYFNFGKLPQSLKHLDLRGNTDLKTEGVQIDTNIVKISEKRQEKVYNQDMIRFVLMKLRNDTVSLSEKIEVFKKYKDSLPSGIQNMCLGIMNDQEQKEQIENERRKRNPFFDCNVIPMKYNIVV